MLTTAYRLAAPALMTLPPETAHGLALAALKAGVAPPWQPYDDPILGQSLWGRWFANPVGVAAGFDKNAEAAGALLRWGFGFVETGTVTPRPQDGNPQPRVFRARAEAAVINRLGFNNEGLAAVAGRLLARRAHGMAGAHGLEGVIGANFGRNRDSADAVADYVACVHELAPLADYLAINVSSPNTPGLRDLQEVDQLQTLIEAVVAARDDAITDRSLIGVPPVLVKLAPDLDDDAIRALARLVLDLPVDGLILTNTTVSRPDGLPAGFAAETGGLSGRPLFDLSTRVLARFYQLTGGQLPLIGVGGVMSGADAYAKIRAGASLVALYTGIIYGGPSIAGTIKRDLARRLGRDGFVSVADAVGADHR